MKRLLITLVAFSVTVASKCGYAVPCESHPILPQSPQISAVVVDGGTAIKANVTTDSCPRIVTTYPLSSVDEQGRIPPPPIKQRKGALAVQNHAAPGAGIPMMALTDALTAKLSDRGFQVINPYNSIGKNQNRTVFGENTPEVAVMELARQLHADVGGYHAYRLRLAIHSLSTGKVVWEGIQTKVKL